MKQILNWLYLLCMAMSSQAFSADERQTLVIVRGDGAWLPWETVVDGKPQGLHLDLIRAVAGQLNLNYTVKTVPWPRAILMLENGEADAITYMSKTEERAGFAYFFAGNILSQGPIEFFTLKEHANNIHFSGDLKSLQPYVIGTNRGYAYQAEFDQATYLSKEDDAEDEAHLLKKMIAKRFLIAAGHINSVKYAAEQLGIAEQIVYLQPYLSEGNPVYLAFSKARSHEKLAERFAEAMAQFKTTDDYQNLLKRYGVQ